MTRSNKNNLSISLTGCYIIDLKTVLSNFRGLFGPNLSDHSEKPKTIVNKQKGR